MGRLRNGCFIDCELRKQTSNGPLSGARPAESILARLTWGLWQYSQDDEFLREVYPGLLRFFERWLTCDADKDGFPEWQSETQTGYTFMPSLALGLPWGQNADIRTVEAPDLLAESGVPGGHRVSVLTLVYAPIVPVH